MTGKIKAFLNDWNNQSQYIRWLMHYTKPYIPSLLLIMLFDIIGSAASIGLSLIGKNMVDSATDGRAGVYIYLLMYVVIVVASLMISVVSSLIAVVVHEKFAFGIRRQVYDKVLNTKWLQITKYHTGDLMTRLTSDTGMVADGISNTIPSIIRLTIELTATFCTLAYFDWRLALCAVLIAPIGSISSIWLGRRLKNLSIKVQESESRYRSFIQESLSNILIIKTFCTQGYSSYKLTKCRDERLYWILKKNKTSLVASTTMSLAFQIGYILAFAWGTIGISNNAITFGTMTVFLTLVNRVQAPLVGLAQSIPKIISVLASAGRIIEIQNLSEEEMHETKMDTRQVGISIDKISFGYTDEYVLDNVSMDINPGEFVAIVGESGIGKTTLIRLIMAFTDAAKGIITFYNANGEKKLLDASAREFISYVPQGNTLFSGTIEENVRMGRLDCSDEDIKSALIEACAYDFVMELPDGLQTVIGERGHGLSEGQAQRIAIARALVRKAPFLILDEATSSLDEQTELKVLSSVRSIFPRPTCLLITHRRSVLNYCDREVCINERSLSEVV